VEINLDLCVRAANCVNVCVSELYDLIGGKVVAENFAECIESMMCQDACPTNAILRHFT
jgi:NAD-dependent dihydropyrimidine dehydrogenase PreA subunit